MTAPTGRRPQRREDFPESGPFSLPAIPLRAAARVIDLMVISIPAMLATIPYVQLDGDELVFEDVPLWFPAAQVVLAILYDTLGVAIWGRTLGKLVLGLRVVRFVDGERPDLARSLQRTLLPNLAGAIPVPFAPAFEAAVYLSSMGDQLGRGWHDRSAGTLVVRTR